MALGGGTFTTQNKILPGAYYNVINATRATSTLSDRGVVAMPIALKWGNAGVTTIKADDFTNDTMSILGYSYNAAELLELREVFKHAQKVHIYNLADGDGAAQAECANATAKKAGSRGNDLKLVVQTNIDDTSKYDVSLYMGTVRVFSQTVSKATELKENAFVTWKDAALSVTAGLAFTGGKDGATDADSYQNALNALESYNFNVLVCPDASVIDLYVAFTKRMRDQVGVKFQTVIPDVTNPDYYGIVQVPADQPVTSWVAGALAGCAINKSCTNKLYDGEKTITCNRTQGELEQCIRTGVFVFHRVEDDIRVLMDINSFVTYTENEGELLSNNQTIRVADQCANDDAAAFNQLFLGNVQNDDSGRISYWNNIVTRRNEMAAMRAIEPFDTATLTVKAGDKKGSVVVSNAIRVIGTMEQLYMTTEIN